MDMKKRSAAIAEFKQNEQKPKVLLMSLKAGGVGLNVGHHGLIPCRTISQPL